MAAQEPRDRAAAALTEAYGSARELLRQAEDDAARIRADADRYRRQREQEAELIVAKARRLLTLAEGRAAAPRPVVDVDAPLAPATVADLDETLRPAAPPASALDAILANAVSNAVSRALPSDR
jgi:hypothetical protein